MNVFRNRFLNTASFLSAPNDPPAGGKKPLAFEVEDVTGQEQTDGSDDAGDDGGAEAGEDAGATGNDEGGDGAGGDDPSDIDGVDGSDDDDDPDLADLPPEVRAKAKAAIEKRVAKETGWRDRQLNKLHARNRATQEDVAALEAIADPARRGVATAPENLTQAQIEDRARKLAGEMTIQQQFDRDANDADAKGIAAYGDKWKTTIAKLPKLGGVEVNDMMDILNTDQPHVVLFSLADPDVYERVMALPPARRRNEYVKLSLKEAPRPRAATAESKRPGNAAPPIVPVGSGRRTAAQQVNLADDKISDEAWYAARNATRRKKFSNVE